MQPVQSLPWVRRFAGALALGLVSLAFLPAFSATVPASTPVSSPAADQRQVSVYFLREGRRTQQVGTAHRAVDATNDRDAALAALAALVEGPNAEEQSVGLDSTVPPETEVLGLEFNVDSATATVDFSAAFAPGGAGVPLTSMAQVVYTLTQFAEIEQASIKIEGKPITMLDGGGNALDGPATRIDYDPTTPLIFLESPAPGDTIASPVRVWGTANTFEATFHVEVRSEDGSVFAFQVVTATSGNGVRGTFDIEVPFDHGDATRGEVVAFERSARDGRVQNEVVIPVTFAGGESDATDS